MLHVQHGRTAASFTPQGITAAMDAEGMEGMEELQVHGAVPEAFGRVTKAGGKLVKSMVKSWLNDG